jgi:hypothetical protein
MRLQKVVGNYVVQEVNIAILRQVLALIEKKGIEDLSDFQLFVKYADEAINFLKMSVSFPNGETVDDISASELLDIWDAFLELHLNVLKRLGMDKKFPSLNKSKS